MEEPISKSQKKREANALQKVGVKLGELSIEKLDMLPLPNDLRQAILQAKSIKSHGAMRRQAQLIGKLMRLADSEAILDAYAALLAEESGQTAVFHAVEQWRERLLNDEGKVALTAFIGTYHPHDVQQLRQLIKKTLEDQQKNQSSGAYKALFRFLKLCIEKKSSLPLARES